MNKSFDITVIGAGIIGLSTAYRLLAKDSSLSICILEKESGPAYHQTGNNSGVIHSGIYYKPGSLKAQNCLRGYRMLIDFCSQHSLPFEICGKIILATDESELIPLEELFNRGIENGLDGSRMISSEEIKEAEPNASGIRGIFVPQTGITDYRKVCIKLEHLLKEFKCSVMYNQQVSHLSEAIGEIIVRTNSLEVSSKLCISCAGLYSDRIVKLSGRDPGFRIIPFRGEYYQLRPEKRNLVRNLIYPVPDPSFPFLGVHFTRRIDGMVEAGPNAVPAFKREGYKKNDFNLKDSFDTLAFAGFRKLARKHLSKGIEEIRRSFSKELFTASLKKLVPEISESDLIPGGSGVRAQACSKDGHLIDDFLILENERMIHVCNAPSPAATASLSIGDTIAEMALKKLLR